ncbi:hypothetical protein EE612_025652 [Oryza sativa]|nr:hypothetical protein EE612_025652 [Oryza sativa]
MISGARKTELFMGQPYRTMPATSRNRGWAPLSTRACAARPRPPMDRRSEAAERRGHGRAPYSAARDPVFFAHHGNIERLCAVVHPPLPSSPATPTSPCSTRASTFTTRMPASSASADSRRWR